MAEPAELNALRQSLVELEEARFLEAVSRVLPDAAPAETVDQVFAAIQAGMDEVGQKFQSGEYFLADMLFAAEMVNLVMPRLTAQLTRADRKTLGRVVLGTVKGDIHDIGKNLVGLLLTASGFQVVDLGIDVPPARFVAAIREHRPAIVALSGLLTLSIDPMKETLDALRAAGVRDGVKVIIGGNPISENIHQLVGSDAWTNNAAEGVAQCRRWVEA